MLLDFSCRNVKSIRDTVTLNLKATNDDDNSQNLINPYGERVLPACAIYGSNATGKSNLLLGLSLMQNIVNTNHVFQPGDCLPRFPHYLSKDNETFFSINFIWKNTKYKYEFTYTDKEILNEVLYYSPNGRSAKIFDRTKSTIKYSEKFSKIDTVCKERLLPNKLVLSLVANTINYEEINNAFLFFKDGLVILLNDNDDWLYYSAAKLEHSKKVKGLFLDFLKRSGSDIRDIKANTEIRTTTAADIPPTLPAELRALLISKPTRFTTVKTVYNGFVLDLNEESIGTQKLLRLLCPIIDIVKNGKTFICDEIESHLHPLLVRQILSFFITDKSTTAQIVCATHDVELLDLSLFRKDQIWFTDINPDYHRTRLFSLSSLSCRKDENIQKKYLESKYCKVPTGHYDYDLSWEDE